MPVGLDAAWAGLEKAMRYRGLKCALLFIAISTGAQASAYAAASIEGFSDPLEDAALAGVVGGFSVLDPSFAVMVGQSASRDLAIRAAYGREMIDNWNAEDGLKLQIAALPLR